MQKPSLEALIEACVFILIPSTPGKEFPSEGVEQTLETWASSGAHMAISRTFHSQPYSQNALGFPQAITRPPSSPAIFLTCFWFPTGINRTFYPKHPYSQQTLQFSLAVSFIELEVKSTSGDLTTYQSHELTCLEFNGGQGMKPHRQESYLNNYDLLIVSQKKNVTLHSEYVLQALKFIWCG